MELKALRSQLDALTWSCSAMPCQAMPYSPCCPALQEATSSLERLRTDLRSWTTRVEAGELQELGKKKAAAGASSAGHAAHVSRADMSPTQQTKFSQHVLEGSGSARHKPQHCCTPCEGSCTVLAWTPADNVPHCMWGVAAAVVAARRHPGASPWQLLVQFHCWSPLQGKSTHTLNCPRGAVGHSCQHRPGLWAAVPHSCAQEAYWVVRRLCVVPVRAQLIRVVLGFGTPCCCS